MTIQFTRRRGGREDAKHAHATRWRTLALVLAVAGSVSTSASELRPESLQGWSRYVAAVEARRSSEIQRGRPFLVMDTTEHAAEDRRAARAGALVVRKMEARDAKGDELDVPSALVHHWRGTVFLPGATLDRLMSALENEAPPTGPEVVRSKVLTHTPGAARVFLRLKRTRIVTVVYNTEHDVRFARLGTGRATSTSVATKIAEVADPDLATERELPPGDDRGFLWRLNAYWRYEAVDGGVMAECESISLSRGVPFGLQTITGPIIGSTARESMERTLDSLRLMAR